MKQLKYRSQWLTKAKVSHFPNLCVGEHVFRTKHEAVSMLFEHWDQLQRRVQWSDYGFVEQSADLKEFFKERLQVDACGPDHKDFMKSLRRAKGAPGLDQWTADEMHWLGNVPTITKEIWSVMQGWSSCTPSISQQLRMAWIPKQNVEDFVIPPKKMRPITVMSVWWRAFSSTWMRSKPIKGIIAKMPQSIHGIKGRGPEVAASIVDAAVKKSKFACTLDFTSCFDTVNVKLLHEVLSSILQGDILHWSRCALGHWLKCKKWFVNSRLGCNFRCLRQQLIPRCVR